jgi:hypothetical protein
MARTRWCGGVLQHVPYVKTMFSAVMALKGACSQAVHNKERCTALAECVRVAAQPRSALHPSTPKACVGIIIVIIMACSQRSVSLCYAHETARWGCTWLEGLCTVPRGTLGVL